MPDIYLYTGETNPNDVRLRNPLVASSVTASLAWIEADDGAGITVALSQSAALAWVEDDDLTAIAVTAGSAVNDVTLAWTDDNDECAVVALVDSVTTTGGWLRLSKQLYDERIALRKQLEEEIEEPIREAIVAQSTTRIESQEADERAIRAAAEAARIEYQALYMRLLAYQRQELLMEEEAIVMTMIAAMSE